MLWFVLSSTALADQCAWNSLPVATAAVARLKPGTPWIAFCEPCGEKAPTGVQRVTKATMAAVSDGQYHEVSINGKPVDLAYTFVRVDGDTGFFNLAKLVDCPAEGVTNRITWPPSTAQNDQLTAWFGTYTKGNTRLKVTQYYEDPVGLQIQIDHPTEHPSKAATVVLMSYADIGTDPVSFATPFGTCKIELRKAGNGIALKPVGCQGLMGAVAGEYAKTGP